MADLTKREGAMLIALGVVVIVAAILVWSVIYRIPSFGRIKALGVDFYRDSDLTMELDTIDWGMCSPGNTYGVTAYCKNIKNTPGTLSLIVENWNPSSAATYLTPGWNYTGQTINPDEVITIQFKLAIDPNIIDIDHFSFDYVVTLIESMG